MQSVRGTMTLSRDFDWDVEVAFRYHPGYPEHDAVEIVYAVDMRTGQAMDLTAEEVAHVEAEAPQHLAEDEDGSERDDDRGDYGWEDAQNAYERELFREPR